MLDALAQGLREVRGKPIVGEQLQVGAREGVGVGMGLAAEHACCIKWRAA
jgi:hypothetical protein